MHATVGRYAITCMMERRYAADESHTISARLIAYRDTGICAFYVDCEYNACRASSRAVVAPRGASARTAARRHGHGAALRPPAAAGAAAAAVAGTRPVPTYGIRAVSQSPSSCCPGSLRAGSTRRRGLRQPLKLRAHRLPCRAQQPHERFCELRVAFCVEERVRRSFQSCAGRWVVSISGTAEQRPTRLRRSGCTVHGMSRPARHKLE